MDFVYVDDVARANILAATATATRRGVQRRQRARDEPATSLPRTLLDVMGSARLVPEFAPERKVNPVPRRLAATRQAARASARFRARGRPRGGTARPGRVVARPSRPAARLAAAVAHHDSDREAVRSARRRRRPRAAAVASGWVTQGPEVAAFERGVRRLRRRGARVSPSPTARPRCTSRCSPLGVGPGDEVIMPVSSRSSPPPTPSCYCGATPGVRRHRAAHLQHRSRPRIEARDHAAHEGDPAACTRSACRPTWPRSWRSPTATALAVIEDAACAIGAIATTGAADRRPHRRRRLLLASTRARSITTGEGGMITTATRGRRDAAAPAARSTA